jgi:hypothetical protein
MSLLPSHLPTHNIVPSDNSIITAHNPTLSDVEQHSFEGTTSTIDSLDKGKKRTLPDSLLIDDDPAHSPKKNRHTSEQIDVEMSSEDLFV